jgi:hypothetical protein
MCLLFRIRVLRCCYVTFLNLSFPHKSSQCPSMYISQSRTNVMDEWYEEKCRQQLGKQLVAAAIFNKLSTAADHYAWCGERRGRINGPVEQTEFPLHGLKRSAEAAVLALPSTFYFPPSLPLLFYITLSFRSSSSSLLSINFVSVSFMFHEIT